MSAAPDIGAYRAFLPLACYRTLLVTVRSSDSLTGWWQRRQPRSSTGKDEYLAGARSLTCGGRDVLTSLFSSHKSPAALDPSVIVSELAGRIVLYVLMIVDNHNSSQ